MPEVDVWVVPLDADSCWLAPAPTEAQRAARFVTEPLRRRYLRSHAALRAILRTYTDAALDFAEGEHGKPWLPGMPRLKFNLSHSHDLALIAVVRDIEIGVDVERLRPMPDCMAIAERFFPPTEAAALADVPPAAREVEFFHRWTRIEAKLKALGIGLYGAGAELDGDWSILPIDVGLEYTASVAANCLGLTLKLRSLTEPLPTEPLPTEPQLANPRLTEPRLTEQPLTEPQATEPQASHPPNTGPPLTDPRPSGSA